MTLFFKLVGPDKKNSNIDHLGDEFVLFLLRLAFIKINCNISKTLTFMDRFLIALSSLEYLIVVIGLFVTYPIRDIFSSS